MVNDYLGSSGVGIHKYGPDTSSSQLGTKSLGTRIPKTVGRGLDHCIRCIICFVFKHAQCLCVTNCVKYMHDRMYMEKDKH